MAEAKSVLASKTVLLSAAPLVVVQLLQVFGVIQPGELETLAAAFSILGAAYGRVKASVPVNLFGGLFSKK